MQEASIEQQKLATALHHAIEQKEMWVAYQPVLDAKTGKIASMEALLRWNSVEL
jgi:sensor c-di-GMP phosphodiesterase-like protein